MNSDQGKLFIGGISWQTSEEKLYEHFGRYGHILEVLVMREMLTGRSRGFAFVVFADPSVLDAVLADTHFIDGRTVDAKRALSREEQHTPARPSNFGNGKAVGADGGSNIRTKKIFVGGLPSSLTAEEFNQYFQAFGAIEDLVVMFDAQTGRPRGFGFITFVSEDSVDKAMEETFHELNGKLVEVKRALPKEANPGNSGGRSVGGSGNTSSYEGIMNNNRNAQLQSIGRGYPAYGSLAYGAPGYGYGPGNSNVGYGGYGAGGYGSTGVGGLAGTYGNPNTSTSGYVSGPLGVPRSPWNNQPSASYGYAGYGGNTGYGATASWNVPASGVGATAPQTSQSPSGAAGYGSQAYGYGGYGGTGGSYGGQGGYGGTGGSYGGQGGYGIISVRGNTVPNDAAGSSREQGSGFGYPGVAYGNPNGYPSIWSSSPSQGGGYGVAQVSGAPGGPAGYGRGFGVVHSQQDHQQ